MGAMKNRNSSDRAVVSDSGIEGAELVEVGLVRAPLRTPTLPPATTTNHYLVGDRRGVLVDPSTPAKTSQRKLVALMAALEANGWTFEALFLTHHHNDHAGAAADFAAALGLPIWAHKLTAARLPLLDIARFVEDGDVVAESSMGSWRALFTPGHAPGHLVLHRDGGGMIAGDMVAGEGTILVDPVEGSMAQYLASLARMRALEPTFLAPAHGPVLPDAIAVLDYYAKHRMAREEKVRAALTTDPVRADALLPEVYGDVSRRIWPIALRSLRAHLIHLEEQGLARRDDERWARG